MAWDVSKINYLGCIRREEKKKIIGWRVQALARRLSSFTTQFYVQEFNCREAMGENGMMILVMKVKETSSKDLSVEILAIETAV